MAMIGGNLDPSLGLLTTEHRDRWATSRIDLLKHESNRSLIEMIESAAFIVCLDDASPSSLEEVS
jgi:carnitine O-acetyltransferase